MGLSEKNFEEEEKGLYMMGIPTAIKPVDDQIDEYFYKKDRELKKTKLSPPKRTMKSKLPDSKDILQPKTWGFVDGILQHNMPCPVCMKEKARYISGADGNYFSPCSSCEGKGYILHKVNTNDTKKKGFWNG